MSSIPDISVIIPCYNGSAYINETLNSILAQQESFEIIVVDDGSTDNSAAIIKAIGDPRIRYVYQKNQGVSAARNHGLELACGKYVVFFDADDVMSERFMTLRKALLENRDDIKMACGQVTKINDQGLLQGYYRGASGDTMAEDILLYNQEVVTCPSNYMFSRAFLQQHQLHFNTSLSSTADRYFLLQCAVHGRSAMLKQEGVLYYRVSSHSMSHQLTEKLVTDNEHYYAELLNKRLIPARIKNKSVFLANVILGASNWKINRKKKALYFLWRAFITTPPAFIKKLF